MNLDIDHCRKPLRRTLTEILLMYRPRQCFRPAGHEGQCSQSGRPPDWRLAPVIAQPEPRPEATRSIAVTDPDLLVSKLTRILLPHAVKMVRQRAMHGQHGRDLETNLRVLVPQAVFTIEERARIGRTSQVFGILITLADVDEPVVVAQ